MAVTSKGNCYLCGKELAKAAVKKHMAVHAVTDGETQDCALLKVEDADRKNYWLYLDIPWTSSLKSLDGFLREIWLECCGHMSAFFTRQMVEIGKATKIGRLSVGDVLRYEYDFGSTTELTITVMGEISRPKQRKAVRLLGRNQPYAFTCCTCGKPADFICIECSWEEDNPFFCEECAEEHEHDEMLLPVVNSPRMGECAYCGELDCYGFNPDLYEKQRQK